MATVYSERPNITTNYTSTRLSGSYLVDNLGRFITDILGRRIIVLSPFGTIAINFTNYSERANIITSYIQRTPI